MKTAILAAAAATLAVTFAAGAALAQDAEAGKGEFKKCMACHAVGEGATNRVGPVLNDVFGRTAGTYEGYKYSQAMIESFAACSGDPSRVTLISLPPADASMIDSRPVAASTIAALKPAGSTASATVSDVVSTVVSGPGSPISTAEIRVSPDGGRSPPQPR